MDETPPYRSLNLLTWSAGQGLDWHAHREFQIIHVLEGDLEVDWGEGWRRHQPGDAHVLPPGRTHRTRTLRGHVQLGLNFTAGSDPRGVIAALDGSFPGPACVRLEVQSLPLAEIRAAAAGLLPGDELRRPTGARLGPGPSGPLARLRLYALLDLYCLALAEAVLPHGQGPLAQRLVAHLQERIDRPLAVAAAAAALGVSRATAQRACRAAFGCGIAHLHERLRLTRAATLLAGSGLAVAECARRTGYADIFGFSRAFRRVLGASPTAYRAARRISGD